MNFNKEKESDVLEEMNLLAEKIQALQELIKQGNSAVSNELQDVQARLAELIEVQKQKEAKSNVSMKSITKREFQDYINSEIEKRYKEENDVWLFDPFLPTKQIPRFVPISKRTIRNHTKSTRFVSLINFKGGVGKTTLTANLASAFATGNYRVGASTEKSPNLRVLVVDLDFQGTLSDRCAESFPLMNATNEEKTAAKLLENPSISHIKLEDLTINFEKLDSASIIPGEDKLDFTDSEHFVKLVFGVRDIRYCYRLWFHKPQVFETYDLVLFDCPPRKTASSVCALMASDYVFIPAAPEVFDIKSVVRTFNWLISFKDKMDIPLEVGGIILNRTQTQDVFSPSEKDVIKKLSIALQTNSDINPEVKEAYVRKYGLPKIFESFVPKRSGANYINSQHGELLPGAFEKREKYPFFTDVATEMYERIYQ